jgi:hypothetical protein
MTPNFIRWDVVFTEESLTRNILVVGTLYSNFENVINRKLDQKYLDSFEMWCWRRMEKISWTDRVNNEAVLHRGKEERNILHTIRRRKANWIWHILRMNCVLKHIIEGKIVGTRRR